MRFSAISRQHKAINGGNICKLAFIVGLSLLLAFVFSGCGTQTATSSPAATSPITTTTPATSTTTVAPSTTTVPVKTYPLTITDLMGRTVQIPAKPVRIITLFPAATETLYQAGGTAIGRDTSSRYPPEAANLPAAGSAYSPSIESAAALNPDLIIIEALSQAQLIPSLEKLGAPVVAVRAASVDDVLNSLTLVGKIIDNSTAAAQAVTQIKNRIEAVKKATRAGRSVLVLISDANRNVYAAKPGSYPGTLAALLGQNNPAANIPDSGPYPGFGLLTGEQALLMNADIVFTISPAPAPAPKLSDTIVNVPGFNQMPAVKNGKVKELDPVLFLQAQGPRIADAAEQMAKILNEVVP